MPATETINVTLPVVIITDVHTDIGKVTAIRTAHPGATIICLGDITDLFAAKEPANENAINYFRENKIPTLQGNHEQHIAAEMTGGVEECKILFRPGNPAASGEYDISPDNVAWLSRLPRSFRLVLPDKTEYALYHNRPNDLWSFENDSITEKSFKETYPTTKGIRAIVVGHTHKIKHEQYGEQVFQSIGPTGVKGRYAIIDGTGLHTKTL